MYRLCVGYVSVVFRLHVGGYGVQEGVIKTERGLHYS